MGHEDWVHSVQWQPPQQTRPPPQGPQAQGEGVGEVAQPLCLLSTSMDRTMMLWRPDPGTGIVSQVTWPQSSKQEKKRKAYAVERHDGSLCTQKQPETAALKAAIKKSDPVGGQPIADARPSRHEVRQEQL